MHYPAERENTAVKNAVNLTEEAKQSTRLAAITVHAVTVAITVCTPDGKPKKGASKMRIWVIGASCQQVDGLLYNRLSQRVIAYEANYKQVKNNRKRF